MGYSRRALEAQRLAYAGALDPDIESEVESNAQLVGKPTDPERFSAVDLEERRLVYGTRALPCSSCSTPACRTPSATRSRPPTSS